MVHWGWFTGGGSLGWFTRVNRRTGVLVKKWLAADRVSLARSPGWFTGVVHWGGSLGVVHWGGSLG